MSRMHPPYPKFRPRPALVVVVVVVSFGRIIACGGGGVKDDNNEEELAKTLSLTVVNVTAAGAAVVVGPEMDLPLLTNPTTTTKINPTTTRNAITPTILRILSELTNLKVVVVLLIGTTDAVLVVSLLFVVIIQTTLGISYGR